MKNLEFERFMSSGTLPARVRIATKIAAGLAASDKTFDDESFLVQKAYKIADELIAQGIPKQEPRELAARMERALRSKFYSKNPEPIVFRVADPMSYEGFKDPQIEDKETT